MGLALQHPEDAGVRSRIRVLVVHLMPRQFGPDVARDEQCTRHAGHQGGLQESELTNGFEHDSLLVFWFEGLPLLDFDGGEDGVE